MVVVKSIEIVTKKIRNENVDRESRDRLTFLLNAMIGRGGELDVGCGWCCGSLPNPGSRSLFYIQIVPRVQEGVVLGTWTETSFFRNEEPKRKQEIRGIVPSTKRIFDRQQQTHSRFDKVVVCILVAAVLTSKTDTAVGPGAGPGAGSLTISRQDASLKIIRASYLNSNFL